MNNKAHSFIEEARRRQIIDATVEVLAESGYFAATFARIAAHAHITQGLISYHFKDKDELLRELYQSILSERLKRLQEATDDVTSAQDKLRAYIEADLTYIADNPHKFKAAGEVLFSLRSQSGALSYMTGEPEPLIVLLETIITQGQKSKAFTTRNPRDVAIAIAGAKDTYAAMATSGAISGLDLERYRQTLQAFSITLTKGEV